MPLFENKTPVLQFLLNKTELIPSNISNQKNNTIHMYMNGVDFLFFIYIVFMTGMIMIQNIVLIDSLPETLEALY